MFELHRRVKLVRQVEATECGIASLTMIANYHGMSIDLSFLRQRFQPSMRGASLKHLIEYADDLNLLPRAVQVPLDALHTLTLPAILHWGFNHCVVIERVKGKKVLIHDPGGSSSWITLERVSQLFTGVALEIEPSADFEPQVSRTAMSFSKLWHKLTGLKRTVIQAVMLSIVIESYLLTFPYYLQISFDHVLPSLDFDLLTSITLAFIVFLTINSISVLLRSYVIIAAGAALSGGIAKNISRHLLRLPLYWFEKRYVGDILSRFQSVVPIRDFLTKGSILTIVDGVLSLVTIFVMTYYSVILTVSSILSLLLYAFLRVVLFQPQKSAQEDAIVKGGREQSMLIETIRGIGTLRLFNREALRQALWQSRLGEYINAQVRLEKINSWHSVGNVFIFGLEAIFCIWFSTRLAINGGFTVGMVFAFLSYKGLFITRAKSLIDQLMAFRLLSLHLDRLADIVSTEIDRSFLETASVFRKFEGRVELRDVGYQYSSTDPWVLRGVNLVVEAGEHIAITGPSGGGKTTLAKVLLGLLEPTEGEIIVDDVPIERFGYRNFRQQVGAVLQEDNLFAGSLADNIALFEDAPDMELVEKVSKFAQIYGDISAMPMQYETLVGDMGSVLSGGQKQRILIARALYRNPKLLLMDEGTAHLDVSLENQINVGVRKLGMTRVVIAHRVETINAADRVIVLDGGRV